MISIIVVTYNRKDMLKTCLNSILSQDFGGEYEIIIIDSGSSDGTRESIERMPDRRIRLIGNKARLDLASCKSLGLEASTGDIIAFTDDDCCVAEGWLAGIEDSLVNYDFVGGPVSTMPGTKLPRWWLESFNWLIGVNLNPDRKSLPLGCNIAFRKYVLQKITGEKPAIPFRKHLFLPYREDNYRVIKALEAGFTMGVNPRMCVYHRIPRERLSVAYLIKRSCQEGRAQAFYERRLKDIALAIISLPINLVRLLIFLDLGRLFRMIANISYIMNRIGISGKC